MKELQWKCQKQSCGSALAGEAPLGHPEPRILGCQLHKGTAGLSLGTEVMATLQPGQGLTPTHTHICTRQLCGRAAVPKMGLSSPCGFLNPSTKFPWPLAALSCAKSCSERHIVRRC